MSRQRGRYPVPDSLRSAYSLRSACYNVGLVPKAPSRSTLSIYISSPNTLQRLASVPPEVADV